MIEGEYRPQPKFQQFGERSEQEHPGASSNAFRSLFVDVQQEDDTDEIENERERAGRVLRVFNLMRKFNDLYENCSEAQQQEVLGFIPTAEQNEMVEHVKLAYGVLARDHVLFDRYGRQSRIYQMEIDHRINLDRIENDREAISLTEAEQNILVQLAYRVGIPINEKQRGYSYASIPRDPILEREHVRRIVNSDNPPQS